MFEIQTAYDRLAGRWDAWAETVVPDLRSEKAVWVGEQVPLGGSVLELGCGTGLPAAAALASTTQYLGLDISPQMVSLARRNVPGGEFRVEDMRGVEFPDQSFDAVIAFHSIVHVPTADQPALFRRLFRWLRPAGILVATLGTTADEETDQDWLGAGPMHWSSLGAPAYRSLVAECGFEVITDEIAPQLEGDHPVEFLWLTCRRL